MCTALCYTATDHYFGRNLDFEHSYKTDITIIPRNLPLHFRCTADSEHHYAMIGMALADQNYPLYFDATNEHGLSIAALLFPDHAVYHPSAAEKINIAPYELIPWALGNFKTVTDLRDTLAKTNIVSLPFSAQYPLTPLHWLAADKHQAITIESQKDGLKVQENPVGVLTNSPPFNYQIQHLSTYLNITAQEAENRFSNVLTLAPFSRGMGSIGLPGDLSSPSRFVRAAFTKFNSFCKDSASASISQFFSYSEFCVSSSGM